MNKIAIYGVCKNEEYNIRKWYSYAKDADYIFLLDTGSTDKTIEIAKELGINIVSASFSPWSETQAKNTALSLLPTDIDICVCLDLDQIIVTPNWKEILSSLELGFGIAEYMFTSNTGYKDVKITESASAIHERNGVGWIKYRPMTYDYNRDISDRIKVDIDVHHLPGTKERFAIREELYIDSFLNELKLIQSYSSTQYFLETYRHIVLSYFENGNMDMFYIHYKTFIEKYKTFKLHKNEKVDAFFCLYLVELAMSIYDINNALEILKRLEEEDSPTRIKDDIYLRIAIYNSIVKNFDLTKVYLDKITDRTTYPEVIDALNDIMENGMCRDNALTVSNYYGNIGWGKSHQKLVNDFIKIHNIVEI